MNRYQRHPSSDRYQRFPSADRFRTRQQHNNDRYPSRNRGRDRSQSIPRSYRPFTSYSYNRTDANSQPSTGLTELTYNPSQSGPLLPLRNLPIAIRNAYQNKCMPQYNCSGNHEQEYCVKCSHKHPGCQCPHYYSLGQCQYHNLVYQHTTEECRALNHSTPLQYPPPLNHNEHRQTKN